MPKRSILHMFDSMPNNSPFDINMALDAGFDMLMPYSNVKLDSVVSLTQDAIFSRSNEGIKRTGIFIGGKDIGLALDMLESAKQVMFPPFQVSVLADPSGAFTTAAALVACVEKELKDKHNKQLKHVKAVVFGGTGPVGIATGVIASLAGAQITIVDHMSITTAKDIAKEYNRRCKSTLSAAKSHSDAEKIKLLEDVDVIFCTVKAGIQAINSTVIAQAKQLKVVGDVNAVPPPGIAGVNAKDSSKIIGNTQNVIGIGALVIGDIKYKLQKKLLRLLISTKKPIYLDFRDAFFNAQEIIRSN